MELDNLRESPAGSGESGVGEWREVVTGVESEEEVKVVESKVATIEDNNDNDAGEKQRSMNEQPHNQYEEELDPRIQVWLVAHSKR